MSIVSSKFLSMSLEDIVEAVQTLQDEVAVLKGSSSGDSGDSSELQTKIDELQAIVDNYPDLVERIEDLESSIQNMSVSGGSETDIDVQDISDRLQALEDVNNDFFGA